MATVSTPLPPLAHCPIIFQRAWSMNSSIAPASSSMIGLRACFAKAPIQWKGRAQHRRVDRETKGMPAAMELGDQVIHTRSVTLSSESLRVIAKIDLIEIQDGAVTPVDYKHGRPRENTDGLERWPSDRVQLTLQGLFSGRTDIAARKALYITR